MDWGHTDNTHDMDDTVQKNISFKTVNEYYLLAGKIHAYLNRLHTYQMVVWYAFSSSLISKHPIPIFVKKGFAYKRAFHSNENLYQSFRPHSDAYL